MRGEERSAQPEQEKRNDQVREPHRAMEANQACGEMVVVLDGPRARRGLLAARVRVA